MPAHNDLVNNTAQFLSDHSYCSHGGNCLQELLNGATFLTPNGNPAANIAAARMVETNFFIGFFSLA